MNRLLLTISFAASAALAIATIAIMLAAFTPPAKGATRPPAEIAATDWLCMQRCTSAGYMWSYCQRICGY